MPILMLNCVTQSNSLRGNYKVAFQAYASRMTCLLCHNNICILYTIQDFLCTLGMKSHRHLVKISIFNESTPFENPQRWMGQNTFPILLLNDDNMIGEHQKTRMKMLYGCPFEKNEKEVFFRLTTFFFRNKIFFSGNNFSSVFYVLLCKKKFRSDPKIFEILFFSKISKFFFKKIVFGSLRNFVLHSNT